MLHGPFDLVYSMTAIYAVPDQARRSGSSARSPRRGAELRLLEYSDPEGRFAQATSGDPSLGWWNPLVPRALPEVLTAAGWTSVAIRDLQPEFVHWYGDLCDRIAARRDEIIREFGRDWYDFVAGDYARILRPRALTGARRRARAAAPARDPGRSRRRRFLRPSSLHFLALLLLVLTTTAGYPAE